MRVWRSGGLTKDAIYLRGLQDLVDYLSAGNELGYALAGEAVPGRPTARQGADRTRSPCTPRPSSVLPEPTTRLENASRRVVGDAGLHQLIGADT